jgi:hypothetical protein
MGIRVRGVNDEAGERPLDSSFALAQESVAADEVTLLEADEEVLVPNSIVAQSVVTNVTRHDRRIRINALVGVSYSSDPHAVRNVIENAVSELEWSKGEPLVLLAGFGDSSVNFDGLRGDDVPDPDEPWPR